MIQPGQFKYSSPVSTSKVMVGQSGQLPAVTVSQTEAWKAGQTCQLTVMGGTDVVVSVTCVQSGQRVAARVDEVKDGEKVVSVVPSSAGLHLVTVTYPDNVHVIDSPLLVLVAGEYLKLVLRHM